MDAIVETSNFEFSTEVSDDLRSTFSEPNHRLIFLAIIVLMFFGCCC